MLGFFGIWLAVDLLLRAVGAGHLSPLRHVSIGSSAPFGPLWFIGVYLVVVALTPWTAEAHRRWGVAVPLVMTLGVVLDDLTAFTLDQGTPLAANLLLVWLIPHQLGYFYADGTLRRLPTLACAMMAAAGLLGVAILTSLPPYPRSLIHARWTVLTMERVLADPARWRPVSRANRQAMPAFLWHMTAYLVAVAALARVGDGFAYATEVGAAWWWGRLAVVALSAVVLATILLALRLATRLSRRSPTPVSP